MSWPRPPRRIRRAFTLIELIVVIVVIALLLGLAAFGYTKFIAGSKKTAARAVAVQVAKTIQGHSANHQLPYSQAVYGDTGTHPAPHLVAPDVPDTTSVSGMQDEADAETGQEHSTVTIAQDGYAFTVSFTTGTIGTPGRVPTEPTDDPTPDPTDGSTSPSTLVLTQPVCNQAHLSWQPVPGAHAYTIRSADTDLWTGTTTETTLTALPAGEYTVTVHASGTSADPQGPASFSICGYNDHFDQAHPIPTTIAPNQTWDGGDYDNRAATVDPGEGEANSLWWTFTAPGSATYTFSVSRDAAAQTPRTGPIRLRLFTGATSSTDTGTTLAATGWSATTAAVHLDAGQTVHVRVSRDAYYAAKGWFRFTVARGPGNDDFAHAATVPSLIAPNTTELLGDFDNQRAGREPGELDGVSGDNTLWWKFTPDVAGTYTFTVAAPKQPGSTPATGPVMARLLHGATSAGHPGTVLAETGWSGADVITAHLQAGQTYHLHVVRDPYYAAKGWFNLAVGRGPANDNFAEATQIPDLSGTGTWDGGDHDNRLAGREPGELDGVSGDNTLWWKFTPSTNGRYTFTVAAPKQPGSTPATGPVMARLLHGATSAERPGTVLAETGWSGADIITADLQAGQTYHLHVVRDPYYAAKGWFSLTVSR